MKFLLATIFGVALAVVGVAIATRLIAATIPDARVTSWWRSLKSNSDLASKGSVPFSAHLIGWAVDLVPPSADVEAAARSRFPFVFPEGDHIHAAIFQA